MSALLEAIELSKKSGDWVTVIDPLLPGGPHDIKSFSGELIVRGVSQRNVGGFLLSGGDDVLPPHQIIPDPPYEKS